MPEHDVFRFERPVSGGPLRQAETTGMLVRVLAGGVPLVRVKSSHPQIVLSECCALAERSVWRGQ